MGLPPFSYLRARTVPEALAFWSQQPQARYLAGGTDLLPSCRRQHEHPEEQAGAPPQVLIDLKGIPELGAITRAPDGALQIGATATVAAVAGHPAVRERFPALATCASALGSYPLRNRATVAGNLCNASPCADTAAALLCLDAAIQAFGPRGGRTLPITAFFRGPGQTALEPGEILTGLTLPATTAYALYHHERLARRASVDISTVAALAVYLPAGTPRYRLSLLSVAPTPLRLAEVEQLLERQGVGAIAQAAAMARAAASPISDVRASAEYRREMVGVLVERALRGIQPTGGETC